jgi:hypothetical protein
MSHHRRRRRFRITVVALVCLAHQLSLTPLALMAAEYRLSGGALEIHHREGLFVDPANNRSAPLKSKPSYILRDGESFALILKDQNPLLFTYDVTTTEVETEQHKIAAQFGKVLAEIVKPFESRAGGGPGVAAARPLVIEGLDIGEFRKQLSDVSAYLNSIPKKLEQSIGEETDVKAMRDAVKAWNMSAFANDVRESYRRVAAVEKKCLAGLPISTNLGERRCSSGIDFRCTGVRAPVREEPYVSRGEGR